MSKKLCLIILHFSTITKTNKIFWLQLIALINENIVGNIVENYSWKL